MASHTLPEVAHVEQATGAGIRFKSSFFSYANRRVLRLFAVEACSIESRFRSQNVLDRVVLFATLEGARAQWGGRRTARAGVGFLARVGGTCAGGVQCWQAFCCIFSLRSALGFLQIGLRGVALHWVEFNVILCLTAFQNHGLLLSICRWTRQRWVLPFFSRPPQFEELLG